MDIKRWVRHQWDRTTAVLVAVGGLAALVFGLLGVTRAELATQQIPYVASGGLVGLFLLGIAATLWLSADLRDEWRKLDDIHHQLRTTRPDDRDSTREPDRGARPPDDRVRESARRSPPTDRGRR